MEKQTYNGWTNYATWRVNLELFDGGNYAEFQWCAESAREFVEGIICESTPEGIGRDYAMAFLAEVNWREIAAHYQENEESN